MKIKTEGDYKKAIQHRNDLLEAYSFLGTTDPESIDKQISIVDLQIVEYEASDKVKG